MSKYTLEFEESLREIEEKIETVKSTGIKTGVDVTSTVQQLERKLEDKRKSIYKNLSRWDRVQLARHPRRPHSLDYIEMMCDEWMELHGDRYFGDDKAIVSGLAVIAGKSIMIIGQQKGRGTKDNMLRNFGMPRPEGYRKALRLMKLAEKFNIPIVTLIDTPGAYPGLGAEERGQAEAIAKNLKEMAIIGVPIINIVIGEGASGGALGIGVGDRLLCMENTWYSVISPEGCASILFRDATRAKDAADAMKVTSIDLLEMGIADRIIPEPEGSAHMHPKKASEMLKDVILEELAQLVTLNTDDLIENRISKFEKMGKWEEI
ncbi:MAG: acetyl-CoA carboxylase carboxyltransferase subunit alpha [Candidatus Marinimicrobia bacterium]|nr:acetyl-CoA carboxylase carboxyltransferase subunit alpha [Candidatus Neomarinimicrobiota bacterium]MBL7022724.1 acetyl-CoA carboxylase carboxyltransferase subunit alpha [Candidatus Neomarinimicrobiota bacterium]MBL7109147.1 acetyl-CoA carboxylase carboxyltransferase subunit alpha [Candidatus Neomarinimicrobiota bacterium]